MGAIDAGVKERLVILSWLRTWTWQCLGARDKDSKEQRGEGKKKKWWGLKQTAGFGRADFSGDRISDGPGVKAAVTSSVRLVD